MTIAYNWTISTTNYEVSNGFIQTAHWQCTATDGEYTANPIYSTCSWADGTPTVPYADVTESEVLAWCWASGVDKDATEAALAQNIELQKNPVQATGTPWATAA
jgi:hypothetical protein